MMKKLLCALVVLTAVPALAQDKQEESLRFKEGSNRFIASSGPGTAPGAPAPAPPAPPVPPVPPVPPLPPEPPMAPPSYGIPPQVAAKIGLPQTLVQKVQDLTFEANEALINLEAEHKRAQLALEKELRQPSPNEASVKTLVEKVGQAETAVRQNRVGLMVAIKKALGPDYWQKLEAEMGSMTTMGMGPQRFRFERRVAPPAPPAPPGQEREENKR